MLFIYMPTVPNQLVVLLKMFASLPWIKLGESYQLPTTGPWAALRPRIHELVTKRNSLIGLVAVEALVKLNIQHESQLYWSTLHHLTTDIMDKVTPDVPFPNILGYLSNILPRLDVEGGVSSADNVDDLPFVLRVNGEHQTLLRTL